jgi:hypothetical protein
VCDQIQRAIEGTVLLIHHTRKLGEVERGSSALRAACDTMIELSKAEDLLTLKCRKMKVAAEFSKRHATLTLFTTSEGAKAVSRCGGLALWRIQPQRGEC